MQFMMGPCPRCYIPSFMQIGPAVPEKKIFEGFLPYMGMVAILVMWPGPHMQTFIPPSHGGSTWNLTSVGPVVPEEKMFENLNTWHTDRQQPCHMISSRMSLQLRWAKNAIDPDLKWVQKIFFIYFLTETNKLYLYRILVNRLLIKGTAFFL